MPTFQILVLDPAKKTRCEHAVGLLYSIRGFARLWTTPAVDEPALRITDAGTTLDVREHADPTTPSVNNANRSSRAFVLTLQGARDAIEPMRLPLLQFMEEQKFEHRYVVRDEISEAIACELYPYLYRLEHLLRGYLTRFMTTRFGGTWWKLNASKEMDDKARMRKKNEVVFGKLIDNSAFLIDFDELGELIFEQTSGFLTREDIEHRVTQLPETIDALKALKADLQSNYHKFFKSAFADRDFKAKWNRWEHLRNKIAHTNLFSHEDLVDGRKLAEEIIEIIAAAEQSKEQPVVTRGEREAMQEQAIAKAERNEVFSPEPSDLVSLVSSPLQPEITEQDFLSELADQESYYRTRPDGFVGLTRFLRFHLAELGFDESAARSLLHRLQRAGKVEVYYVENPYDSSPRTAALRTAPLP
jgi:hypothetical protein